MPGKKKKKFIDKKNAVTFSLVHRSQRDPLQADEDAPQMVLLPTGATAADPQSNLNRMEEQQKYGIFFDDDYDYMQHLRDVNELYEVEPGEAIRHPSSSKPTKPNIQLPSSVFGSNVETDVGLLNKAAPDSGPHLDWDPDIVAALDDDFNYEDPANQLDDDFIEKAMEEGGDEGLEDEEEQVPPGLKATMDYVRAQRVHFPGGESDGDDSVEDPAAQASILKGDATINLKDDGSDGEDDVASDEADVSSEAGSDGGNSFGFDNDFAELETKSRFTSYSMTSSVMRRNEGLTMVDDRFEKLYEQYDEEEIGALDHEEISGYITADSQILNSMVEEFEKTYTLPKLKDVVQPAEGEVANAESESGSEDDMIKVVVEEKPKEQWDCESILSTYSNLYNHPQTISEPKKAHPIKLTKRAQLPADTLPERGLTRRQIEQEVIMNNQDRAPTYRPQDETTEERKARKAAVKEERKARREQKKATKTAFKEEKKKQQTELLNVQRNLQGLKLS